MVVSRHRLVYRDTPVCGEPCYAGLAVSSPAVAKTISSTHCTYPRRYGFSEWACVAWINAGMVDPPEVVTNRPSYNRSRRRLT